jgi:hypothetical protein
MFIFVTVTNSAAICCNPVTIIHNQSTSSIGCHLLVLLESTSEYIYRTNVDTE